MRARTKRYLARAVLALAGLTALAGVLHTAPARPLLHALGRYAGCPVDLEGGDPVALERFRSARLKQRVGIEQPRSSSALGFVLGKSTESDVRGRLSAFDCVERSSGSALVCEDVALDAGPRIDSVYLRFFAGKLVAVDLFRAGKSAESALGYFAVLERELGERVGPPTKTSGDRAPARLASGPYRRVASEFRYASYVAEISLMSFGERGFRVRETYEVLLPERRL